MKTSEENCQPLERAAELEWTKEGQARLLPHDSFSPHEEVT